MSNGRIQLDVNQQTVLFIPKYRLSDYGDVLLISRSLSGPNDRTIRIANLRETHETYGPGSYEYPLAFALREAFTAGAPAIWAFSSSAPDLFEAIPKLVEEAVYPFAKDLKELFDELHLAAMKYVPKPYEPDPNVNYRDVFARANENQVYNPQTMFTVLPDPIQLRNHCGDPAGPPVQMSSVKQTKDFRNIGKSSNAKKRW